MPSRTIAIVLALTVLAGCRRKESRPAGALIPASGLPTAFTPIEWAPAGTSPNAPARELCPIVLGDDRDGTRLRLMRSQSTAGSAQRGDTTVTSYVATGDYAVTPTGKYGVSATQWLRVSCGTWRGLGIVPAQ